jgi:hypothetical protein
MAGAHSNQATQPSSRECPCRFTEVVRGEAARYLLPNLADAMQSQPRTTTNMHPSLEKVRTSIVQGPHRERQGVPKACPSETDIGCDRVDVLDSTPGDGRGGSHYAPPELRDTSQQRRRALPHSGASRGSVRGSPGGRRRHWCCLCIALLVGAGPSRADRGSS